MEYVLTVRTEAQKVLFEKELSGQISDGWWENETTDERLWGCVVVVGEKTGCNFPVEHPVDFTDNDLSFLYPRMISYCKEVDPDYNETKLISDLTELTEIVYGAEPQP